MRAAADPRGRGNGRRRIARGVGAHARNRRTSEIVGFPLRVRREAGGTAPPAELGHCGHPRRRGLAGRRRGERGRGRRRERHRGGDDPAGGPHGPGRADRLGVARRRDRREEPGDVRFELGVRDHGVRRGVPQDQRGHSRQPLRATVGRLRPFGSVPETHLVDLWVGRSSAAFGNEIGSGRPPRGCRAHNPGRRSSRRGRL